MRSMPVVPSTRDALLAAGRQIVVAEGFGGLTVRKVAAGADANLGSFVYHFGTRDRFVHALIEQWYAPVVERLTLAIDAGGGAIERLRRAILKLIDFMQEQDVFLARLLMAAADGDAPARRFLRSVVDRHPRLLLRLVRDAQRAGELIDDHPTHLLLFIMASVGLPRLLTSAWNGPPPFGRTLSATLARLARERDCMVQRLHWALRGLSTDART